MEKKRNKQQQCMVCGSYELHDYNDEFSKCQRCGAKYDMDENTWEYNPNEVRENIEHYDKWQNRDEYDDFNVDNF